MLRSNRKNSPNTNLIGSGSSSSHGSSTTNSTLPTHYHHQDSSHGSILSSSSTPSIPFSTLQRQKRRRGGGVNNKNLHGKKGNKSWAMMLFVMCACIGLVFKTRHYQHHPATLARHYFWKQQQQRIIHTTAQLPSEPQGLTNQRRTTLTQAMSPPKPPLQTNHGTIYDIIILGAGPAGLTAALFAARAGLSTLVLGSDSGSLAETFALENFPSFLDGKGPLWLSDTKRQAAAWGATFAQAGLLVDELQISPNEDASDKFLFDLKIHKYQLQARSVIVATGATGRRLNLPHESELWGKAVHTCAVCDGSSYTDRVVVVVGGGDAAVDGALLLSRYARFVILVHRRTEFRASNQRNLHLLRDTPNIRLELSYVVKELETTTTSINTNNNAVQQLTLNAVQLEHVDNKTIKQVECDGVFELIGSTPNTQWLQHTKTNTPLLDEQGFVQLQTAQLTSRTATTLDGLFAAGEVTDSIYRQAITAAAEGAQAAMDAERWLRNHALPTNSVVALQETNKKANAASTIPLQTVLVTSTTVQPTTDREEKQQQIESSEESKANNPAGDDNDCDLTQTDCITKVVNQHPVVVFSKRGCPYCRKAFEALAAEGLPQGHANLHVVNLSLLGGKTFQVQQALQSMTGRRTVPNVFVGGQSIGGGDETSNYHRQGHLHEMLVRAKAVEANPGEDAKEQDGSEKGAASNQDDCDLTRQDCITQVVNQHPVVVFSKPWCPYCRKALEALAAEGLPEGHEKLHVIDLSQLGQMRKVQDTLQAMTGRRTVPNVFVNGKSIGGGDETSQFHRLGKLHDMLVQAEALG